MAPRFAVLGNVESVKISDCLFNDNQTINRQLDSHGGAAVLQAASIECNAVGLSAIRLRAMAVR